MKNVTDDFIFPSVLILSGVVAPNFRTTLVIIHFIFERICTPTSGTASTLFGGTPVIRHLSPPGRGGAGRGWSPSPQHQRVSLAAVSVLECDSYFRQLFALNWLPMLDAARRVTTPGVAPPLALRTHRATRGEWRLSVSQRAPMHL